MEDIEDLIELKKDRFSQKEWLILKFARQWAALRGREPEGRDAVAYKRETTEKERADILKICRMMKFANYTSNTLFGIPYRADLNEKAVKKAGILGLLSGPVEGLLSDAVLLAQKMAA